MKKQILPILGLTTLLVAPVALADETEISPKPTAAEAISKSDIMFRADETEVDPDNPEVVDPTDPETPGIVKPDDSDGTSGNGNSSFNITWVSNFRFYDLNEKNERVGVKLNANGMNVWSKGTKLSLEKEDKEVKTYEDIPNFIQVVDNRGKLTGWNLKVSSTPFKGTNSLTGKEEELKGASLSLNHPDLKGAEGIIQPVVFNNQLNLQINGQPNTVLSAAEGAGTGNWTLSFGESNSEGKLVDGTGVKLDIPASASIMSDVDYSSDILWTLEDTPTK